MTSGNNNPLVTLLLPNYNNENVLDMFFTKLIENTKYQNYEFIAVDDGSTDSSLEILRRWQKTGQIKNMRIVENSHQGIPKTLNSGFKLAKGKYICRFDGDATLETPGWLHKMIRFMETDTRIGMVVAKIVFSNGSLHSVGRSVICPEGLHDRGAKISEKIMERTLDSKVMRLRDSNQFNQLSEIDTALGCCTLFPRDLADRIGGIDENFSPVWIEDDDFGLSVRKYNKKVFYFPEAMVIHHVTSRLPRNITRRGFSSGIIQIRNTLGYILPSQVTRTIRKITGERIWGPWRYDLLQHHYKYWQEKWGFDPLNPDLEEIKAKWGDTEICWNFNPAMKRQGEEIITNYLAMGESELPRSESLDYA